MEKFDLIFWIKSDNERNPTERASSLEEALETIKDSRPGLVILSVSDGRPFDIRIRDTRIAWFEDGRLTKSSYLYELLLSDFVGEIPETLKPPGGVVKCLDTKPDTTETIGEKLKSVDASLVTESSRHQPYFVAINQDETGLSLNEVGSHSDEIQAYNSAIEMVKKHGGFSRVLKQVAMVTQISCPKIAVTFTKEN